jgi:pyruvate/2-oxoglutarate dehydrogenase complex dihydrolipoamide dehydrogenase (E3) component
MGSVNGSRTRGRFDLIVIGGGPAGVTAALRGAELGAGVALVERRRLGGTCTDDGCAPTRVLAKAARLLRDSRQLGRYGIASTPPAVDLAALMAATQRTVYQLHEKKQLLAHLERAGVTVVEDAGDTMFAGPHTIKLGRESPLEGDRFIVACGGYPRRLPFPGSELGLTHSDVWGLHALPRSLAVIGGSATGAQLASVFGTFGSRVTLLEIAPRILAGEDEAVSAAVAAGFAAAGIEVETGIDGVDRIDRLRQGLRLAYRSGEEVRELEVDAVILAVGWPGRIETLHLDRCGVTTERGYILVDDGLRTSAPHVWAAGDVTGRMMLVQSATYEGRIAAENAVAEGDSQVRHRVVAHGGFTDPEYGSVGLTEAQAAFGPDDPAIGLVRYADLDRAVIDGRTEGFCKLIVSRETRRIVGAHVVGEQAVEVVQIAAAAMAAGMPVERLAEVEFAYPTFTSIVGLAARQVVHALRLPEAEARAWETLGRPRVSEWERREAT